jgi:hypothetical protein
MPTQLFTDGFETEERSSAPLLKRYEVDAAAGRLELAGPAIALIAGALEVRIRGPNRPQRCA